MIREARKPSADPVQEKLRQDKDVWNKKISVFITNLIHCKKLMNGSPNKFNKQRSRIGDPIPANPATILSSLANDFQELAQQGDALVQEQLEYAKNRKKKQVNQPNLPPVAAPKPTTNSITENDLSKKLSLPIAAMANQYLLLSEASNPVSRFWTKLITPTRFGVSEAARIRQYRIMLLKTSVILYKTMGKLQVEIVKSSKSSLASSNKLMQKAWNEWLAVVRGFNTYITNMPNGVEDTGGPINIGEYNAPEGAPPVETPLTDEYAEELKFIRKDYLDFNKYFVAENPSLFSVLFKLLNKAGPGSSKKSVEEYKKVISILNTKYKTNGSSLETIYAMKNANVSVPVKSPTASAQHLEKISQDFLKKWLGYGRHSLWSDDTSVLRKDAYNMAKHIRENLDSIVNSVQKGLDAKQLAILIKSNNFEMSKLKGIIRAMDKSDIKQVI